jgi:transcriptional regulator with XRE-family HTH domain
MAGLSAKELAGTLGASASTVSRWENGNRNISKKSDAALRLICFAGMLQEILMDRNLLPRVADATKKLSEVNICELLGKVTNRVSDAVHVTIDPRKLYEMGERGGAAAELPAVQ